jgi:hypothetical protein
VGVQSGIPLKCGSVNKLTENCFHSEGGHLWKWFYRLWHYTGCPTRYQTRHFFNNFTTIKDIATKFEAGLPNCVRNVKKEDIPV